MSCISPTGPANDRSTGTTHRAICITGLERSLRAISGKLRAALSGLHRGLDRVSWFGVRPRQDHVRDRLPPLRAGRVQRQCVKGRPKNT